MKEESMSDHPTNPIRGGKSRNPRSGHVPLSDTERDSILLELGRKMSARDRNPELKGDTLVSHFNSHPDDETHNKLYIRSFGSLGYDEEGALAVCAALNDLTGLRFEMKPEPGRECGALTPLAPCTLQEVSAAVSLLQKHRLPISGTIKLSCSRMPLEEVTVERMGGNRNTTPPSPSSPGS